MTAKDQDICVILVKHSSISKPAFVFEISKMRRDNTDTIIFLIQILLNFEMHIVWYQYRTDFEPKLHA